MTNKIYAVAFWIISLFLLIYLLLVSKDFGITFDEWTMSNGGLLALRFLFSGGQDRETLTYLNIAGHHPQFFNCLTNFLYGLSTGSLTGFLKEGLHAEKHLLPFFELSHRVNAFFGFLTLFYAGRIAKEIGGARAGVIALLIMAFSPRFIGDSMNNSKDIPFAGAYAFTLFYMLRFLKEMPAPKIATLTLLVAGISAAIGVRVGGYLLLCYLVLFVLIVWFTPNVWSRDSKLAWKLARIVGIVFVLAYFGGMIFWPFAQVSPFKNTWRIFQEVSHYELWNGRVLFQGERIQANQLPWFYLPKWIGITVPITCLAGLGFFAGAFSWIKKFYDWRWLALAVFSALFPVAFIIVMQSIVYDAWRHVLFIYAPLCVVSALGWDGLFRMSKSRRIRGALGFGLILLSFGPLTWMIRNHPNEYVYFNPLVGGVDGALGRYETDYFGNCLRESAEWLTNYHEKNNPYRPLIVRADGNLMSSYPYLSAKFHKWYFPLGYPQDFLQTDPYRFMSFGPYVGGPRVWDYALVLSRDWEGDIVKDSKAWPPPGTIYEVKADHATLCAVVKNPQSSLK